MAVVFAAWAVFAIVLGILIARKRRIQQYQTHSLPEIITNIGVERVSTRRQHKCTLTTNQLQQLPEMSFDEYMRSHNKSKEKPDDDVVVVDVPTCAICLEAYCDKSLVRTLTCSHVFHVDCIDQWLLKRSCRCPMCNFDVRGSTKLLPRHPSSAKLVN
ncbi:hypothetical protein H4S08_004918 [Coemansia sp. RSA 1365]|nr:hypothetical protein H4S08_004918 [Coemansia sp. RSA 1365]